VRTERLAAARARFRARVRARFDEHRRSLQGAAESPGRLGLALGVGVVCGCSPFLGLQTLLAIGVALLFRLNKLAVFIGLQISIPPLTPLVILASVELGEFLLHGRALPLSVAQIRAMQTKELVARFFVDLSVGGLTLGTVLGALLGMLTARWISRRRAQARPG
jgi:uncharacterized protein (DUF2062 family)